MKELTIIQTELNAPKRQFNKFGDFSYRNCEDILAAVKPLLKKTETSLTMSDDIVVIAERIYVKAVATLTNSAGEKESATAFAEIEFVNQKKMDASQRTGSASSYARKYALGGLFAIDDTKDSDATNTYGYEETAPQTVGRTDVNPTLSKQQSIVAEVMSARDRNGLVDTWRKWQKYKGETWFDDAVQIRKKELGL